VILDNSAAAVLGQQSGPDIAQLPSTSTGVDGGGLVIGFAALSAGLALLRRRVNN